MEYNRNFFIAIGLSLIIFVAWHFLYIVPQHENLKNAQTIEQQALKQNPASPTYDADFSNNAQTNQSRLTADRSMTPEIRRAELAKTDRITIKTDELEGSINLVGAQFDDLFLKKYHLTVDKTSPQISLLNPNGFKTSYLAEFGFTSSSLPEKALPQSNTQWQIESENTILTPSTPVTLVYNNGQGQIFRRTISIDDHYMFTIEDSINNESDNPVHLSSYARVARAAPPEHAQATYLLHEGMIGIAGNSLKTETYEALSELTLNPEDGQKSLTFQKVTGGWIGITDKYWAVAVIPSQNQEYTSRFVYFDRLNTHYQSDLQSALLSIAPRETKTIINYLFAGAKRVEIINQYQNQLQIKKFGLLIDWGWFDFITKPMFSLIHILYEQTGNFGIAILLTTVLLKTLLFPLANKSYISMARMKIIQPMMQEIKEKYAEDRVKQQHAIIQLYKTQKINPLAGCLPMLIQFPIFFALYKVLYITLEMRHAPFFGWIQDLAAPDPTSIFNLFGFLPYAVPAFFVIGAWPLVMGITMFLQMQMNPPPVDPIQATLFAWLPIIFTFMLASFPAGLVIYWAWNNTLSIIQQSIIMKRQGVKIELFNNIKTIWQKAPKKEVHK
ncbi:membrane protein insertase, YidC/Oxa1 family domain [Bartonella bacilliformis Peru38]|uniref:Membrane protein insertase YidC n=2 Tax=Bartonella bacilliformis TaxID=774 RepID=A1UTM0_BARBK|nr:membrane protein insertase YidC [Bartonella bacilliformis]ABM45286.1 inner membrane protein, 60Kd [Bartonella bacilliformis KC583]AMG86082.1 membrane protein insertase YidC [Bartonella bacilliformis]EKS43579.1 membrane protein insertase [Bartonella bacilliformis INS]EYS89595.1 membrane protein insertase, YidC/Oxa1 family domain [Bartonella bacilliformis San Pedro600-02]EYS94750.1 membrane protein insertase, YidC/Oxa1 family domain [Bartonella bacilliformis Peru-18]